MYDITPRWKRSSCKRSFSKTCMIRIWSAGLMNKDRVCWHIKYRKFTKSMKSGRTKINQELAWGLRRKNLTHGPQSKNDLHLLYNEASSHSFFTVATRTAQKLPVYVYRSHLCKYMCTEKRPHLSCVYECSST